MENKNNYKKLLCYNIVNNCKCVYKNKCMFAHALDEQIKEPMRQYVYKIIYEIDDLSEINLNEEKNLLDELLLLTKECKNCMNKKCPGGYNCKYGVCLRENKICYNDLMYGKCYNMLMESTNDDNIIYRCIHGIHLSEKKLIPYNQRMLTDLTNIETNFLVKHSISFNSKNNIISLCLNDNSINIVKDIISNKLSKNEIINDLKKKNYLFNNNNLLKNDTNDDNILDDIIYNFNKNNQKEKIILSENEIINNEKIIINFEANDLIDNIVIYDDDNLHK